MLIPLIGTDMTDSPPINPDDVSVDAEGLQMALVEAVLQNIEFEQPPAAARESVIDELGELFEEIDSAVVVLDYWLSEFCGLNTVEIGDLRGVSHQTVASNIKRAEYELGELEEPPDWVQSEYSEDRA